MNIDKSQLDILLVGLCCVANECDDTDAIDMVESAFDELDRGDGKNDFVFKCDSCQVWLLREDFGKFGECNNCYADTEKEEEREEKT